MLVGVVQIVLSSFCFSVVFALVKSSDGLFPVFQVAFARGVINSVLAFAFLKAKGIIIRQHRPWGIYIRSIGGLTAMLFYFTSLRVLPLGDAVTINSSTPLFMTLLLFWLGRPKPQKSAWFFVGLGFLGVVILLKPEGGWFNADGIWGLVAVIFLTATFTSLHHISRLYHPEVIVFYFTSLVALAMLVFFPTFRWPHDWQGWGYLVGIGLAASAGQAFFTRGMRRVPLIVASQGMNLTILVSVLFGLIFFNETLKWNFLFGGGLIVVACSWLFYQNRKSHSTIPWPEIKNRVFKSSPKQTL